MLYEFEYVNCNVIGVVNEDNAQLVLLVLEGGIQTLKTTAEAIRKGTPVVVIKDSGRAADFIAYAFYKHKYIVITVRQVLYHAADFHQFTAEVTGMISFAILGTPACYRLTEEHAYDQKQIRLQIGDSV